ncbi:hypothetical protein GUJ93_ZPchr0849g2958 [Zizania palustris]|uniref:Uncharacterized protein n=1 Tax=Zizania palustris TaxID=103762 RepID=A0A8J5V2D9_ZIZPA|nr:hypothetical protein GUJ93_ZPchr0849g2958 [Zizania palustris]
MLHFRINPRPFTSPTRHHHSSPTPTSLLLALSVLTELVFLGVGRGTMASLRAPSSLLPSSSWRRCAALGVAIGLRGPGVRSPPRWLPRAGRVWCDTCRAGFETPASTYIAGAKVMVECKSKSTGTKIFSFEGQTDHTGTYTSCQ